MSTIKTLTSPNPSPPKADGPMTVKALTSPNTSPPQAEKRDPPRVLVRLSVPNSPKGSVDAESEMPTPKITKHATHLSAKLSKIRNQPARMTPAKRVNPPVTVKRAARSQSAHTKPLPRRVETYDQVM